MSIGDFVVIIPDIKVKIQTHNCVFRQPNSVNRREFTFAILDLRTDEEGVRKMPVVLYKGGGFVYRYFMVLLFLA